MQEKEMRAPQKRLGISICYTNNPRLCFENLHFNQYQKKEMMLAISGFTALIKSGKNVGRKFMIYPRNIARFEDQSIFASARRREGVRLLARRTLGATILVLRPESFLRATITGADDLVTR